MRHFAIKLLTEICELRKKNAKIKIKNDKFKNKNTEISDLKRKLAEFESKKVEPKIRIAKLLRQAVEESRKRDTENAELKARIIELEKNRTVTTKLKSKNAEFRDRIIKVKQRQMQNDNVTKVTNSSNNSNNSSSNFNSVDKKMDTSLPEELILETDAFLDEMHKKKSLSSTIFKSFHHEADLFTANTKYALSEQLVKELSSKKSFLIFTIEPQNIKKKQVNLSEIKGVKLPYNQKVEQDLIYELLEFIRYYNSTSLLNSISSKHIPNIPVDADLTSDSVSYLARLFDKAEKTGQKEKL
ncbi:hypothetical protein C1646_774181 [Rhizophagus diaphanus]|nr:hypothetical protein C1646_774181 [Rhizophagus diaphanus] [Rhizophagus sp. MUCL 43196]